MESRYIKSSGYTGVYYCTLKNGDISYFVRYFIDGAYRRKTVGRKSEGMNEKYASDIRAKMMNKEPSANALYANSFSDLDEDPDQVNFPTWAFDTEEMDDDLLAIHADTEKAQTLNDLARKYYTHKAIYNKDNFRQKRLYFNAYSDNLGKKLLTELTTAHFHLVVRRMKEMGRKGKTINKHIETFRSIINWGIANGHMIGPNPTNVIEKEKVNNKRMRFLSKSEILALYKVVANDPLKDAVVRLLINTGARYNAIRTIKVKHILKQDNMIMLHDLKGDDTYYGFIDSDTKRRLMPFMVGKGQDEFLFTTENGKLIPARTLQRYLKEILDPLFNEGLDTRDSVNRVVVHSLRHTFASQLALKGVSLQTIQKLLNHKSIDETMRYAKLLPGYGKEDVYECFSELNKVDLSMF